jgi:hypothetical protein
MHIIHYLTGSEKKLEKIGLGGIQTGALTWRSLTDTELNHYRPSGQFYTYGFCVLIGIKIILTKSVLGRVRNCVGEQALRCEMVASSYVCQPNHSYADSMFCLHSDHTRGCVVAGVLHSVWSELSHQGTTLQ